MEKYSSLTPVAEVEVRVSLPIFTLLIMVTVGEMALSISLCSSTRAYISSSLTLRDEPRPMIITLRESVPISAKLSRI